MTERKTTCRSARPCVFDRL